MRGAVLEADAMLARQHVEHAGDIGRPVPRPDRRRTRRAPPRTGVCRPRRQLQRHVTATAREPCGPTEMIDRCGAHGQRPQCDAGGLANRPLQDERPRVVGDAAHDVQPSRRAGDEDRTPSRSALCAQAPPLTRAATACRKPREVGNVVRDPRRGTAARRCHATRPRRFSARCRCGSTSPSARSLAKPIQVTSDVTSSGAAS